MASKESDAPPQPASSAFYSTASGRLVPPISATRLPPPGLHTSPYSRPHEFYRSLYGPAAAQHLASGSTVPSDVSLLETYSRTFGAGLQNSNTQLPNNAVISKAALVAAASSSASAGLPLGLTTNSSRVSPSSTSSVSSGSEGTLPPTGAKPVALNKA